MSNRIPVVYVTSNPHKREECDWVVSNEILSDGTRVDDFFEMDYREAQIKELLEIDLTAMVYAEVVSAYCKLKVPCIVEHAGLIFEDRKEDFYPGGLTKPMWIALGKDFVRETHSAGRRAIARAVVGYCDGSSVKTFVGETAGVIAEAPRGNRKFYWDTVFVPDEAGGLATYAEIVDDSNQGLPAKMKISQSKKALMRFFEHRKSAPLAPMWNGSAP